VINRTPLNFARAFRKSEGRNLFHNPSHQHLHLIKAGSSSPLSQLQHIHLLFIKPSLTRLRQLRICSCPQKPLHQATRDDNMSDDSNPPTSSVPAGSEAVEAVSDAPESKQSIDANGTSANDDVAESSKKVAPESVAPVKGNSFLDFLCFPYVISIC
jgi:ABC-type Zn2+ transport system substrate-binding protein/surface adhesin